tara:strand:+ start:96 stop:638 length:543 start_codon:yes stop_codon:yes gene_type:complete
LSSLIFNLSSLIDEYKIQLNIVGTGNCKEKVINDCKKYNIKAKFHGRVKKNKLDEILIKNSDIVFAMGTSAVEAAKLRIPSVITPIEIENEFSSNNYMWLFDAKEYELSVKKSHALLFKDKLKTLEDIIKEVTKDKDNSLGAKCFKHYDNNHSIGLGISKIIYAALNTIPVEDYTKLLEN